MTRRVPDVPEEVFRAAETSLNKWRAAIPTAPKADPKADNGARHALVNPDAGKTHEQLMIEKIRHRMKQYPEWYETRPEAVAEAVGCHLDRICEQLARELPDAEGAVEVWQIPLSVFNWLKDGPTGETFFRGALSAWSSAEQFNAANATALDEAKRAKLRAPFLDIAPLLLTAVLSELLTTGLWVSLAQRHVGSELKFLVLRVQQPVGAAAMAGCSRQGSVDAG